MAEALFIHSRWESTGQNRTLRVTADMLFGDAAFQWIGAFFPFHLSEAMSTSANTMNTIVIGMSVPFLVLAMGFGAAAYRNWFRLYTIGLFLPFLVEDIWATWGTPFVLGGQRGPLVGVEERTMIYGFLLCVVTLAIPLICAEGKGPKVVSVREQRNHHDFCGRFACFSVFGSLKEKMIMSTEAFAHTRMGQLFIRIMAAVMESRFRYHFFDPKRILQGAEIRPGQTVLEVGCGTGFFTLPAARLLEQQGSLVAIDILPMSVHAVTKKVQMAGLKNVQVIQGDALNTRLAAQSFDAILLFGVIPAPMLPMERLLSEMQRILKPGGTMAVWPPSLVHQTIVQSGLFTFTGKQNSVYNYKRNER